MTIKPESLDTAAAAGGGAAAIWNFVLGGNLNIVLGAVVAILSIVVLIQRYMINRKELTK